MMQFATDEWAEALRASIDESLGYRRAGAKWDHGAITLLMNAAPKLGVPRALGLWLDLERGRCRSVRIVTEEECAKAPFCITGDYLDWKSVMRRELDPVKAVVSRRLRLRGSLFTLLRYVPAALELVNASQRLATEFPDEMKKQGDG